MADAARAFGEEDRRAIDVARRTGNAGASGAEQGRPRQGEGQAAAPDRAVQRRFTNSPITFRSRRPRERGCDELRNAIVDRLPEGPAYFPEDHVTDQPERFLAAELVREKVLLATRQEVPHSVAVTCRQVGRDAASSRASTPPSGWSATGRRRSSSATKGAMLKHIGTLARQEMERLFGVKIYLDLHVRVQPGWREKPAFLNALDWRTMAGEDDS